MYIIANYRHELARERKEYILRSEANQCASAGFNGFVGLRLSPKGTMLQVLYSPNAATLKKYGCYSVQKVELSDVHKKYYHSL